MQIEQKENALNLRKHASVFKLALGLASVMWVHSLNATQIAPQSYVYNTPPSSSYPDSGGELTDGAKFFPVWGGTATVQAGGLVGWQTISPSITFNFATPTFIDQIIVYAADSDGAAGVGVPLSIDISGDGASGYSDSFTVSNPAGSGTVIPIELNGIGTTSSSFTIRATPGREWTMFSEIEFFDVSPSVNAPAPASLLLMVPFVFGLAWRKRTKAQSHND